MDIREQTVIMYVAHYEFFQEWLRETYRIPFYQEVTPKFLVRWPARDGKRIPFDIVQDWAYARVGLMLGQGMVYQIGNLTILNYRSMN